MKIKRIVFTWENIVKDTLCIGTMNKLDIVFDEKNDHPVVYIDAGNIKIEDESLNLDCKEILKKAQEIDFDAPYDISCHNNYSGDVWKLTINEKVYEGILEEPHYVSKIKKIIRFNAIQVYANKKLAGYIKN